MIDKMKALMGSRRFWVAVAGVVFVVTDALGVPASSDTVQYVVMLAGAWIVGDSLRETT